MTCWVHEELQREWELLSQEPTEPRDKNSPIVQVLWEIFEHRRRCKQCIRGFEPRRMQRANTLVESMTEQIIADVDAEIARLKQVRNLLSGLVEDDGTP
jgi:hypothetical protein